MHCMTWKDSMYKNLMLISEDPKVAFRGDIDVCHNNILVELISLMGRFPFPHSPCTKEQGTIVLALAL